jgi:hypothetical protein
MKLGEIRPRWAAWFVVVLSLVGAELRYRSFFESYPVVGAAVTIMALGGCVIAVMVKRHDFMVDSVESQGPPYIQANLRFDAMPYDWQRLIWSALDKKAQKLGDLRVNVTAEHEWLTIRRVWNPSRSFEPLEARYPLGAITDVVVGQSVMGLIGSTLTFKLAGGDVRFDVQTDAKAAEVLAQRFRQEATHARSSDAAPPFTLQITR